MIASGIYPPDIGGPAQYARNLYETWKAEGHEVKVAAYRWERAAPPFIKHLLFMTKVMRKGWDADMILVLDNFLAAVPAMFACALMRKPYIIRTGGDLLWEWYVERTGELILFKDFYSKKRDFSLKEKIIDSLSRKAFKRADAVIFSSDWQKRIWEKEYGLDPEKAFIVENFCGERLEPLQAGAGPENRSFVAGTRPLKWKNVELLKDAFADARTMAARRGLEDIELDCGKAVYDSFVEKIRRSYAVILASLGDISPNMIFDAIRAGTPFILTKETGIADRVRECAVFVDPQDKKDIAEKVAWMADPKNRAAQAEKVRRFAWVHTWGQIGDEIISVWERMHKRPKGRIG